MPLEQLDEALTDDSGSAKNAYLVSCLHGRIVVKRFWLILDYSVGAGLTRITRITCHATRDTATCAAFIKESRMELASATKTNRKSGFTAVNASFCSQRSQDAGGKGFGATVSAHIAGECLLLDVNLLQRRVHPIGGAVLANVAQHQDG